MAGRVGRSLKVSEEGKQKAQKALTDRCLTQKELGKELGFSRETVSKFFRGLSVDRQYFVKICEELRLEWDEIVAKPASQAVQRNKQQDSALDIDVLVQEVRSRIHDKIQYQCGTMRMLDISYPVVLSDIYTDVNILEQITSQQWLDIPDLLKGFNPESDDFDTPGHGKRRQRVPGLDAVSRYSKLMLLGKPGAGKTTFLQWVAIKCDLGEFQLDRVPIFIQLKNFAEDTRRDDSKFKLLNYISQEFSDCGIADKSVIEMILTNGKALILLDGLDEVSQEDDDEVVKQIRRFVNKYFKNQFIITCRIPAQKYRFQAFTDVEVADFNDEQVAAFATKWFLAVPTNDAEGGKATAKLFIKKLSLAENKPIRKLAVTPILLNLTCFVFQAKGEFPSKRSELYEQGLNIPLSKWDEYKGIQRDEVYPEWCVQHKIELLTQVAALTFEKNLYLFEQREGERCIANYLHTLPNTQNDRAILQRNSQALLKSIEAEHGLLVERARGIYSFSHLTFQEYFTAKWFVERTDWKGLISHISEKSWREVFLLSSEMMKPADSLLLLLMKRKIDGLVAEDDKLQKFLGWVDEKARSVDAPYKLVAVRTFYTFEFDLIRPLDRNLSWDLASHYEPAIDPDFERGYDDWLLQLQERETFKYWDNYSDNYPTSNPGYSSTLTATSSLQDKTPFNYEVALDLALDQKILARDLDFMHAESFALELDFAIPYALDSQLRQKLQSLRTQLSASVVETWENWEQWWQENGQSWTEQLRAVMIEHRNIGHDWQLSDAQKQLLQQYYDANKLLVDCLNSDCDVSREVRQDIEDTLLLPMAEIEKSQQRIL
jgi:predicted NACHT family NTPase